MTSPPPFRTDAPDQHTMHHSERLDAELDRFDARSRSSVWRKAVYAVFGAIIIVGIGVWGFGFETNTRNAPVRHTPAPPPGSAVMVVIKPA